MPRRSGGEATIALAVEEDLTVRRARVAVALTGGHLINAAKSSEITPVG